MQVLLTVIVASAVLASGCANFQRSPESGYASSYERSDSPTNDHSTQKTAYELGKDPNSMSSKDLSEVRSRQRLKELEKTLHSPKEKEQYSKVLPWFRDDEEKIAFLSIPSLEGRQQWMNRVGIWDRAKAPQAEMKQLM